MFGFTLPRLPFFGDGNDDAEEIKRIDSTIARVTAIGYDTYRITLADGTVWETTEGKSSMMPRNGDKVTISRGTLGGYSLQLGSRAGVKARRVQ